MVPNRIDIEGSLVKARLLGYPWTLFTTDRLRNILMTMENGLAVHPDWKPMLVYETPADS